MLLARDNLRKFGNDLNFLTLASFVKSLMAFFIFLILSSASCGMCGFPCDEVKSPALPDASVSISSHKLKNYTLPQYNIDQVLSDFHGIFLFFRFYFFVVTRLAGRDLLLPHM